MIKLLYYEGAKKLLSKEDDKNAIEIKIESQ